MTIGVGVSAEVREGVRSYRGVRQEVEGGATKGRIIVSPPLSKYVPIRLQRKSKRHPGSTRGRAAKPSPWPKRRSKPYVANGSAPRKSASPLKWSSPRPGVNAYRPHTVCMPRTVTAFIAICRSTQRFLLQWYRSTSADEAYKRACAVVAAGNWCRRNQGHYCTL